MRLNDSRSLALNVLTILALLLSLLPTAAPVQAQTGPAEIIFKILVPTYQVATTSGGYHRLALDGFSDGGQPGQPVLPYRVYNLALPPEADPASLQLELLDVEQQTLPGAYRLEAARAPQIKSRPLAPGAGAVCQAGQPAAPAASLLPYGQLRRWQFARVNFAPAGYDPNSGAITLITRATLRLTYAPRVTGLAADVLGDDAMDAEAAALLDNFDQARAWFPERVKAAAVADYVILTTEAIRGASASLDDFVAFKQSQGYAPLVVTETDYGALNAPAPNGRAEKIRAWLQDNYAALGIRYALLIGNPDPDDPTSGSDSVGDLPMKMCFPTEEHNTPTDYFYADLTGNWNLDCDRGTGGIDLTAEVYVGRIPVYNGDIAALDSILQKTIAYEADASPEAWRKNVLLPMSFVDSGTDDAYFAEQMKADFLTGVGFSAWTLYQQGGGACGANSSFASSQELRGGNTVRNRWNAADFGLVTWSGHGSETGAAVGYNNCWDGDLMSSSLAATLDDDRPSVVYASSCTNGYPENSNNLGYAMLRSGAVATVSASRVSWYVPADLEFEDDPSVSGIGYEFNRRLLTYNDPVGKALFDAKNDTAASADAWLMNKLDMNLYGDPTVTLLSTAPPINPAPVLDSLSPDTMLSGEAGFTLTLTGSNFIESSVARWNGANLPTTFVSDTQLTAAVDAGRIATSGVASVTVSNPQPGGGLSAARSFLVYDEESLCAPAAELLAGQPDTRRNDSDGSTDEINQYPGVGWDESGPEFAYSFTPTVSGSYTARLSGLTVDLDLFVLNGASGVCASGNLLAFGDQTASFTANAGQTYYLVVDGYAGGSGEYTLTVSCPTCPQPATLTAIQPASAVAGSAALALTVNGVHFEPGAVVYWDDTALTTSRANSTRLSASVPAALLANPGAASIRVANPNLPRSNALVFTVEEDQTGVCDPLVHFSGPNRDARRNDSFGATHRIAAYPGSARVTDGPEFAYSYTPPSDRLVSARLSGLKTDLDLAVIAPDAGGRCLSDNALALGDSAVSFQALAGQTYYFVVDGVNGAVGSYTLTVEDDIPLPEDGAQLLNNRPVFNWEDVPGASGYQLQVSTTNTFRSLYWNRRVSQSIFFPTGDLLKNRLLYWRAVPRFGSRLGPAGTTRVLSTANPPSMPSLLAPASGSLQRDLTPRLDWLTVTPAATTVFGRYQVQVARDPTFLMPVVDHDVTDRLTSEYTMPAPLDTNTRYYWRARAFDTGGQSSNWTLTRTFRTALAAPLLSAPRSELQLAGLRPVFEWTSADSATSYTLQVSASNFRGLAIHRTVTATSYQPAGSLLPGRMYAWRVRANGPNGPSAWSEIRQFYTP